MSVFRVRFLTRVGCHLCDDARPMILAEAKRVGAVVEEVDVDHNDELLARYGMRIPVLLGPGGEVLAEGVIDDRKTIRAVLRSL